MLTLNDGLRRIWKETLVENPHVVPQNLSAVTKKNIEKPLQTFSSDNPVVIRGFTLLVDLALTYLYGISSLFIF